MLSHLRSEMDEPWLDPVNRYLIIGGTSKAATTSVFNYLALHPDVAASDAKETRFFLDAGYPLKPEVEKDCYDDYFSTVGLDKLRVEATPDYLYSPESAAKISAALKNVSLAFILRDPVDRLVSWYRFGKRRGEIPQGMTFDSYVRRQVDTELLPQSECHPVFLALRQGRYSDYLEAYYSVFMAERIYVTFYEDLKKDNVGFMGKLCDFAKIDSGYADSIFYETMNRSYESRSEWLHGGYVDAKVSLRRHFRNFPAILRILRTLRLVLTDPLYYKINQKSGRNATIISDDTVAFLEDYYRNEPRRIFRLTGLKTPWPRFSSQCPDEPTG